MTVSHSKEQHRKKAEAMKESMEHHRHATVTGMRDGKDHEAHKSEQMGRDGRGMMDEINNSGAVGGGV